MKCKTCGTEFEGKFCPGCGTSVEKQEDQLKSDNQNQQQFVNTPKQKNKKPIFKKWWFWSIIIIVAVIIIVNLGGKNSNTAKVNGNKSETNSQVSSETNSNKKAVSVEFKNALKKAETYSNTLHMSKSKIYDQLTSEFGEKFPANAAQYAIDNIKADWNANALEKAKTYQKTMKMSKNKIYDQLTSEHGEKFTKEEAQYAIDHLEE